MTQEITGGGDVAHGGSFLAPKLCLVVYALEALLRVKLARQFVNAQRQAQSM
jgi:hypothetical protein